MAGLTTTMARRRHVEHSAETENEAVRRTPPPAEALLALQRQAGNHAVSRMLQRIELQRDRQPNDGVKDSDEDRTMVAVQLTELPLELRDRLIADIGAQTIRTVVTSRLLLTPLTHYNCA